MAASATGAVGPGHGRRRAFEMPDREYGRDTEVATTGRDTTRRDPATSHTGRDPAPDDTARDETSSRDGRYRTRSGDGPYRTRRPSSPPCPATGHSRRDGPNGMRSGDGRYRTRHALSHAIRRRTIRYAMIISYPNMPGNARKCPDDVRTMPDDVSLPGLSGTCFMGCERPNAQP